MLVLRFILGFGSETIVENVMLCICPAAAELVEALLTTFSLDLLIIKHAILGSLNALISALFDFM